MNKTILLLVGLILVFVQVGCSEAPKESAAVTESVTTPKSVAKIQPVITNKPITEKLDTSAFVGSKTCVTCHADQYERWQQSDHYRAMETATSESVLGDFDNVEVNFHNNSSRLYQQDDKYFVDTLGTNGKKQSFEIKQTFGFYPLQQYLVETEKGRVQALNIAWDSRSKEEGGNRWFHLREDDDITPEDPFFWGNHFQNWNSRCADCHSTNVKRNYDVDSNTYNTTYSEINVACESCHGAGEQHVTLAKTGKLSENDTGFSVQRHKPLAWQFQPGQDIAEPIGQKNSDDINMCGSCHSLHTQLTETAVGKNYHDSSYLQLLNEVSYFADGQIREEVFVLGSFMQSKMYEKGVTCGNCHDAHSGKVLVEDNGLCSQCHKPQKYDSETHHHHEEGSEGAACVNCHMPQRTYMGVDKRRDHSFTIPRPELSAELGVPNACTTCHSEMANEVVSDKDTAWAIEQLNMWGVGLSEKTTSQHWANLNHRVQMGDVLVTRPLTNAIKSNQLPGLINASLLQQLSVIPSRVSLETALQSLQSPNPLVRRAAVMAIQPASPEERWQMLSPYLKDPSRSVRFQIAGTLADVLTYLPLDQQVDLSVLIDEYRESLAVSADSPATQMSIGNLEMRLGNNETAEKHYLQSLRIEPNYVPALVNLADYYRASGREPEADKLLIKALEVAPDSGGAQYSYALSLIRGGDYQGSLPHLKLSTEQIDSSPHYSYVYAVALEELGQLEQAIAVLKAADERWPNQYELLITLVMYIEKTGDSSSALRYLSRLTAIAPNSPEVKEMVKKYR
jgi:tetratricopeptide (TPR) repeat protein